ncbi:uncharacterized protein (DUF927 family) [Plasticicumulans lactativorans]|uniref:Uncharacterized protein (DUF927 family) n=1 Tax=Plasticicumulans lactativorans TaxID=1133106 RepID=A0A4R2LM20_9GAMM|nr:DUF927 domain-containing protein [Plasticicumulans lactativorans]TCO80485.1 uncharacterized protein (DUF927 family) [Plasticicumulans lactativorans]
MPPREPPPDFGHIKAAALAAAPAVLAHWLPDGTRQGREWIARNPRRSDAHPGSFSVNMETGAWSDFATRDKGGDFIALVAYLDDVKQGEAARRLADFLGLDPSRPVHASTSHPPHARGGRTTESATWDSPRAARAAVPVPADAPEPPAAHPTRGAPSERWVYRDAAGRVLFYVCRFDPPGVRKQFAPLVYGPKGWQWKGLPAVRPLYGLDRLARHPDARVVVCEGEKAADAAAQLLPNCVATTSPNGAQSPGKADWSVLAGRRVWGWPDADAPGAAYLAAVAEQVRAAGGAWLGALNLALLATDPGHDGAGAEPRATAVHDLPEGWDAADALRDGWTAAHMARIIARPDWLEAPAAPQADADRAGTTANDHARQGLALGVAPGNGAAPGRRRAREGAAPFELLREWVKDARGRPRGPGVYWFPVDRDGESLPPEMICSPLEVIAYTREKAGAALPSNWGRLLVFEDLEGHRHEWAMPAEMLGGSGEDLRRELLRQGLPWITGNPRSRTKLGDYLLQARPDAYARCVERTGWHGGVYVFPLRTIGEADERVIFQAPTLDGYHYSEAGTLAEWREHVAALCLGNSRLLLAVSTAFAALLLQPAGEESGGLHIKGGSSSGKTTALRVAASVFGPPEYLQRWRATDNAIEATAAMRSDSLLILDELAQVDPKAAGEIAYMLANGEGKARAQRTGAARDRTRWRLLFLSAGEIGLAEHMAEAGKKVRAGQEIRFAELDADAGRGFGVFDILHGRNDGEALSRELCEVAARYHGTAAPAFLAAILPKLGALPALLADLRRGFIAEVLPKTDDKQEVSGQAYRVAARFALIAAAGELAALAGITGWPKGEAKRGVIECFRAWLDVRGGPGPQEDAATLAQVRHFFELHGEARFSVWDDTTCPDAVSWPAATDPAAREAAQRDAEANRNRHARVTVNRAGFRRLVDGAWWYYVLPQAWHSEVCEGIDARKSAALLLRLGMLKPDGKGKPQGYAKLPGMGGRNARCYIVTPALWAGVDVGGDHEDGKTSLETGDTRAVA